MRQVIVAALLLAACRDDRSAAPRDAGRSAAVVVSAHVPKLPPSPDPAGTIAGLDGQIAAYRDDPREVALEITLLLERAHVHGRLEDYSDALALAAAWRARAPGDPAAWRATVQVLTRMHRFAAARDALDRLEAMPHDPDETRPLAAAIDEASGHLDKSAPAREAAARAWANPANLVALAGSQSLEGKLDDALATMQRAAAAVHDNPPELLEYVLFQWGRIYELRGEFAAARDLFAAARARLPTVDNAAHLARAEIQTGERDAARAVVGDALRASRYPELVALAAELAPAGVYRAVLVGEARAEWQRYVAALPEAFADHAARFYLGVGGDPARALALAKQNLANRDTTEARALLVEAALAAREPATACAVVDPLVDPSRGPPATRAQRFAAWRALSACGRNADAERLAAELGIGK